MKVLILTFIFGSLGCKSLSDHYTEELLLSPLGQNRAHVGAFFRFTTRTKDAKDDHFEIFPRPVGELLKRHGLREVSVSLGRGVWRWGWAPFTVPPPGAVVSAWFEPSQAQSWKKLVNALSGQLCASLNFLDESRSTNPIYSFQPEGALLSPLNASTDFRLATLPAENLCTENLTPWKKLLPCQGKRGLASLLNARRVQETSFHSLTLSLKPVCADPDCSSIEWELSQTATLVLDLEARNMDTWSVRSLFGSGLNSACPLASSASLLVDERRGMINIEPSNAPYEPTSHGLKRFQLKTLLSRGVQNLIARYSDKTRLIRKDNLPPVRTTRYITGHGQEKGGIVTRIVNDFNQSLPIVYLDVVPWYLRLYIHTLKIMYDEGKVIKPSAISFTPGRDRERPYVLEIAIALPPRSTTLISIEFERSLLKWLEYPPDANKGFFVGSALVSTLLPPLSNREEYGTSFGDEGDSFIIRLYSETLVVSLPTPDFSMPYNVICLACTVLALAFGPLHNITTKQLSPSDKDEFSIKSMLKNIKRFLKL